MSPSTEKDERPEDEVPAIATGISIASEPPENFRTVRDYDESDTTAPNFVDHFSLRTPSSTVRFRGARVHVYEAGNEQILLEDRRSHKDADGSDAEDEDDNGKSRPRRQHRHTITVKRMPLRSFGLRLLRLMYALISILLAGFAFVLCFQIIIFLFFNLPVEAGATSIQETDYNSVIAGIIFSLPAFLFGMASLMAMATTFVGDAWSGGTLVRAVFGFDSTVTEILYFLFYIFIPVFTFVVALMLRRENPWELACYAWVPSVTFVFCCFGLAVVWREVQACFRLLSIHYGGGGGRPLRQIGRAALLTQKQRYCGYRHENYLVAGDDLTPEGGYSNSDKYKPIHTRRSLYTRFAQLSCLHFMYDTLDPPKRLYAIDEVRDVMPFITNHNWSLESMFCTSDRDRHIVSVKGASSLTRPQVMASIVCNVTGSLLLLLAIVGFFVWMKIGWLVYLIAAILCFICCLYPMLKSNYTGYKMYSDINEIEAFEDEEEILANEDPEMKDTAQDVKDPEAEVAMFGIWETTSVVQPKPWVCYTGLTVEIVFFFLWPMITLFATGNTPVGTVFLFVALFSFVRRYFDPTLILSEIGSMDGIDIETETEREIKAAAPKQLVIFKSSLKGADKTLVLKARLADILGHITNSRAVIRWMWVFLVLAVVIMLLFLAAAQYDDGLGDRPPFVMVSDYYYPGEDSLQYPTCALTKAFRVGDENNPNAVESALLDYIMISMLSYETTNVTSYVLDRWFGKGQAIDNEEFVTKYRLESNTTNTPVYFKLFTFPNMPHIGVIGVRGSQTALDWCVNMQLWGAAGLAQLVKWLTPYGWIWTPVLDELVSFVDFIQSDAIKKVSYYTVTSRFVEDIMAGYGDTPIQKLFITGASLGGGLALITGAQTTAYAVGISAPGLELSRHTLKPPVTVQDINERVFNFIPDRDYIAFIGGRPRQSQAAECTASTSNLFGCHAMARSLCEIAYRCGTGIEGVAWRPVLCRCHYLFKYPKPLAINNTTRSFAEACQEEEQAFLNATGSTIKSSWQY